MAGRPRTGTVATHPDGHQGAAAGRAVVDPSVWADGAMTVQDAQSFLGCKRTTMYGYIWAGRLVTANHGVRIAIAKRSLVRLLEELQSEGQGA